MIGAYSPPRDLLSKVRRRLTQEHAARQAELAFDTPILSITFDDFPATAADAGARVLERHGARGTFYASSKLADTEGPCGRNFAPRDIERLVSLGHEIGCHTSNHADCARRDVFTSLEDLARNRDALMDMGAPSPRAHAYPYGETTRALKEGLPPRFASARGVLPGLNVGKADLAQLRSHAMFGEGALTRLHQAMRIAAKRKAWVIAFTHDVSDAPSPYGTRTTDLDELMRTAHALGFTVLPISAALQRRLP